MPMASGKTVAFDPWQAEQAGIRRNRLAEIREAPAETIVHSLAYLALAGLLLPLLMAGLRDHAEAILGRLLEWRGSAMLALLCLLLCWQVVCLRKQTAVRENGWLAAQPIGPEVGLRNTRRHVLWRSMAQLALMLGLGVSMAAPIAMLGVAAACAVLAGLLVGWSPTRFGRGVAGRGELGSASVSAPGRGRLWRWQRIEVRSIFGPKRFASMLLLLLLIPTSSKLLAMVFFVVVVLGIGLLAAAWQRSLSVLPQAQHCFAVQPIRARRLLAAWVGLPLAIVGAAMALVVVVLSNNGAAPMAVPAVLGMLVLAGLGMACVAAERRHPRRAGMVFSLHLLVLLATLQALPPAALLVWPAQMVWLLRRSLVD